MKVKLRLACLLTAIILALACSAAVAAPRAIGGFFKQDSQTNDMSRDERGEFNLFRQSFGGLSVDEEIRQSHPWLADSIEKITKQAWQDAQKIRRTMKEEAAVLRKEAPGRYHPFEHDYDVLMCRADTFAVSFIQKEYTGGDGAHGMYGWQGVTLSAFTGARIPLASIVRDREALAEAICARLRSSYPEGLYEDMEKTVREMAAKDQLNWTLDPRGITFYFNPYAIAPYAVGLLTTTILFKEEPELFHKAYCQTAPAYAQPFTDYYGLTADLEDTGKRTTLKVTIREDTIHVKIDDRDNVFPIALVELQPVFIHMEDGRNYLYIDGREKDTSIRKTLALQLENKHARQIAVLPYSFRHTVAASPAVQVQWNFLTNPNGFYFDQSSDFTGNSKTDICAVGKKGTLTFG